MGEVCAATQDLMELKYLFQHMVESTEETIKSLEAETMNTQLCVSAPAATSVGRKQSPRTFFVHLNQVHRLHNNTLKSSNSFLRPRVKAQVSRDIVLGLRIRESMKKHMRRPVSTGTEQLAAKTQFKNARTLLLFF